VLRTVLVLAVGLGALAGCGGEGDRPPVPPPSKAEYIVRADRLCRSAERDIDTLATDFQRALRGRGPAGLADVLGTAEQLERGRARQFRAIPKPAGAARTGAAAFERTLERRVAAFGRLRAALAVDDGPGVQRATTELDRINSDGARVATAYGFRECGREG
jgi:hypothetical protein